MKEITDILSNEINSLIRTNDQPFLKGTLKDKEFSIFDDLELKTLVNGLRFLILKNTDLKLLPVKHISRVVNALYLLYGYDDWGNGKFSEEDIYEFNNNIIWGGRSWLRNGKYVQPAMIHCEDNGDLKLMIMNV
jgi:hypothetical protein